MGGLFGPLNVDEVPDDPYFIENGTYQFLVTAASIKTSQSNNSDEKYTNVIFKLKIDQPGSKYHGQPNTQSFRVYPELTAEDYAELDKEDQLKIDRNASNLKVFLRALGFSETSMGSLNKDNIAEETVGKRFLGDYSTNTVTGDDKQERTYKNLNNMRPVEDAPETSTADWLSQ